MSTKSNSARRYDFDVLRGVGALGVVAAHCASLFTTWSAGLSGVEPDRWIAQIAWLLNPWLMPLFMLLAGASMWYALRKQTIGSFARTRAVRLLVPVACATLIIVPAMQYIGCLYSGEFSGSFLQFYPWFFRAVYPVGKFSFLHFWFLVYLALYTFMALPIFAWLRGQMGQRLTGLLAGVCGRPGGLYILALPLLAIQLVLWTVAPQPDLPVLVNDWERFVLFFCLFVYGYLFMSDARFSGAIAGQWRLAGVLAGLTSAVLLVVGMKDGFNPFADTPRVWSAWYFIFHTVFVLCSWSYLLFLIGIGQRYLNVSRPIVTYGSTASYGIYLLHPLIWPVVGMWVNTWEVAPLVRFAGLFTCVLLGTLALYEVVRRCGPVCTLLGLKPAEAGLALIWALHLAGAVKARHAAHVPVGFEHWVSTHPLPAHARSR